ncbi:MAG: DUF3465 domain-containing protein [Methylophilaceae bacterium]
MIKKFIYLSLILFNTACSQTEQAAGEIEPASEVSSIDALNQKESESMFASASELFARKLSDQMVEGEGRVVRLLADDNEGSRHQKFLVEIEDGQTLLFAHNIDLAPRIGDLKVGDEVQFLGEYEYNYKGGLIHWTHFDPEGQHVSGWIKHNEKTYQ